jgi:uncharacterized flavoprotein (TIGR03862 family)
VTVFDRMLTPARKFLRAGHGGLNLTNALPLDDFIQRYGLAAEKLAPALRAFTPQDLAKWCEGLGIETFIGTSGRVFPKCMKASPLLRAWRTRLQTAGVTFVLGTRWTGWNHEGALRFIGLDGSESLHSADATLLALGGASWPQLGSDARWTDLVRAHGISIMPFRASNCGFSCGWSEVFAARFAGQPIKPVLADFGGRSIQGELMVTRYGIEGGPVYALSAALRTAIETDGHALLRLNLRSGLDRTALISAFEKPRASQSLSNYLRKAAGLSPIAIALVQEYLHTGGTQPHTAEGWADLVSCYPLRLNETGPIERAISSAGGISFEEIDAGYQLKKRPHVFVAGEMLDWDAPTGGFLLQACFSTGVAAAQGILETAL